MNEYSFKNYHLLFLVVKHFVKRVRRIATDAGEGHEEVKKD